MYYSDYKGNGDVPQFKIRNIMKYKTGRQNIKSLLLSKAFMCFTV